MSLVITTWEALAKLFSSLYFSALWNVLAGGIRFAEFQFLTWPFLGSSWGGKWEEPHSCPLGDFCLCGHLMPCYLLYWEPCICIWALSLLAVVLVWTLRFEAFVFEVHFAVVCVYNPMSSGQSTSLFCSVCLLWTQSLGPHTPFVLLSLLAFCWCPVVLCFWLWSQDCLGVKGIETEVSFSIFSCSELYIYLEGVHEDRWSWSLDFRWWTYT